MSIKNVKTIKDCNQWYRIRKRVIEVISRDQRRLLLSNVEMRFFREARGVPRQITEKEFKEKTIY